MSEPLQDFTQEVEDFSGARLGFVVVIGGPEGPDG